LCVRIYNGCCTLNKLDASTNGNHAIYRNPRALSSALATPGTLQPRALGFLNRVVPLVSASNYYLDQPIGTLTSGVNTYVPRYRQTAIFHGFQLHFFGSNGYQSTK